MVGKSWEGSDSITTTPARFELEFTSLQNPKKNSGPYLHPKAHPPAFHVHDDVGLNPKPQVPNHIIQ